VKAALVFGSGVWGSLTTPAAAERLVAASRFGDLLGARGGLLCALAAVALWAWQTEAADPNAAPAGGRRDHAAALAALSAGTLGLVAAQGHASQAPLPALSVAFDAVHLGAAAIWLGGLACLSAVLRAAPRRLPDGGGAIASAALRRFSRVALVAVGAVAVTGALRALGELGAFDQLWATAYGRSLLAKSLLLAPVGVLALRNRRAVAALAAAKGRPTGAALRAVWRDVRTELALGMTIVLVAAVLVAQVPGRA
jgi:copper transport protein